MSRARILMAGVAIAAFVQTLPGLAAAPVIGKVEPPNWWVPNTRNPVQILLTGSELQGAAVTSAPKGVRVEVREVSKDGRYVFLYADIGRGMKPGSYTFTLKTASGTVQFPFRLDAPLESRGRFQGVTTDDVIYLLMPDRFANGDSSNDNGGGQGPAADRKTVLAWHGGDLKGIREHLAYLKELGVTGIWLTPVYKNSAPGSTGYHGYHTVDFYAPEPRFGTMSEYRALVDEAHRMGIKVVQDQVANHSGPSHPWAEHPPTPTWFHGLDRMPRLRNNFDIAGLADPYSRPSRREIALDGWFAGHLPDFNQTDSLVSDYLLQNALWWIGMTGVDGVRQDTYPYVDRPFWEKWQSAIDAQYPGFFVTGEVTARTPAVLSFFEGGTKRAGADTGLPSLLDFPLEDAIRKVFAQGQSLKQLPEILAQDSLFRHPENLVSFIGNHDQPRFLTLAGGDVRKLMMAYTFLLTTPRIPHLYYGDELALGAGTDRTDLSVRADFPGGFPGDAVNAFSGTGRTGDAALVFAWLQKLLRLRSSSAAIRHGQMIELSVTDDQYSYLRRTPQEIVLVILNRRGANTPIEIDLSDMPLSADLPLRAFDESMGSLEMSGNKALWRSPSAIGVFRWTSSRQN